MNLDTFALSKKIFSKSPSSSLAEDCVGGVSVCTCVWAAAQRVNSECVLVCVLVCVHLRICVYTEV